MPARVGPGTHEVFTTDGPGTHEGLATDGPAKDGPSRDDVGLK